MLKKYDFIHSFIYVYNIVASYVIFATVQKKFFIVTVILIVIAHSHRLHD